MVSPTEGGSNFLSDRILDERAKVQPGMPKLASTERVVLEALAYLVAAEEDRQAQKHVPGEVK